MRWQRSRIVMSSMARKKAAAKTSKIKRTTATAGALVWVPWTFALSAFGKLAYTLVLLPGLGFAQPELEMQRLVAPRLLEFSPDGSRLWYKLGAQWWEVATAPNSRP